MVNFMKNLLVYLISSLPTYVLFKFLNLFLISQGKGFSNPRKEANLVIKFANENNIKLKKIFDIGAYHGDYTFEILKKFPETNYYLFELDETNFNMIKKNSRIIKN
tara:strand:- start:135 stop:452 length:318 start_codon:yes stop_codon:yes gene_type:complete